MAVCLGKTGRFCYYLGLRKAAAMRIVKYKGRHGEESYEVLERSEADTAGIAYLEDWRDAGEVGECVLTDDGYVVLVLNVGRRDGKLVWIRTCTGSYTAQQSLTTKERQCRWTFSGKNPGGGQTPANRVFAVLVAHGMDPGDAYMQTHPRAKDPVRARERAMLLLQSEMVRKIVAEELGDILAELKIDKKFILLGLKRLANDSEMDTVKLAALKELGPLVGVAKKSDPVGGGGYKFLGISSEEMAQVEAAGAGRPQLVEIPAEMVTEAVSVEVIGIEDVDPSL